MKYAAWVGLVAASVACKGKEPTPAPTPAVPAPALSAAASPTAATEPLAVVPASAPAAKDVKYAVFGVKSDDVLNVRAEPSVSGKKVFSFGPDAKNIRGTGNKVVKDKTPWVEVAFEGGTGWLNRFYVTEIQPGGGCNDPELAATIRTFMRAVDATDGAALSAVSSPLRGLLIRQEHANPTVTYSPAQVGGLFSSPTSQNWGTEDARDVPIIGPFKTLLLAGLKRAVVGKGAQEKCGKLLMGGSAGNNEWPPEFASFTQVSFHVPATDGTNDWLTWVAGMEYVDGKPYVAALVQYQWEI